MKLELIDRFTGPDAVAAPFRETAGRETLVAGLGRPGWRAYLVLVDDEAMAALNGQYRGKPAATDVLSFSYLRAEGPGDPALAGGERGAAFDLWLDALDAVGEVPAEGAGSGEREIGEILIAPAFVSARCAERGWPLEHELPLLVVHGCLHLLGWDHEEEDERDRMRALETGLLAAAGLPHPLAGP